MTVVVFMVAGMSSRFGGMPKQMAIVGPTKETLIEYSVKQALIYAFSKIIFITNAKTEKLFVQIFDKKYKNIPVEYIQQKYNIETRSRPWGTTDAICSIINNINEPFIMLNGDDIYGIETFKKGFALMKQPNINVIGGLTVIDTLPDSGSVNRGIIFVQDNKVTGLKEMINITKNDNPELHNELANVNFIGLQPSVLNKLKDILDEFKVIHKNDKKIECLLTDNLNELIKSNLMEMTFFEITNSIIGITNPGDEDIVREQLSKYTAVN